MKKIIAIGLILSLITLSGGTISTLFKSASYLASDLGRKTYCFAVLGYDEAAYNTDSIIVISLNPSKSSISFLQIPRDTYFEFDGAYSGKINGVVPTLISQGSDIASASNTLVQNLSSSVGISINGFIGLTPIAVKNFVDAIGGVEIDLPIDITGRDPYGNSVRLQKGYNLLDGNAAVVLLRHRASYPLGDIERIDMQKLFISALSSQLSNSLSLPLAYKLLSRMDDCVYSNLNLLELFIFGIKELGRIKNSSLSYATIPGEALMADNGVSYYCINKYASANVVSEICFSRNYSFDENKRFLKKYDGKFSEVYYSKNVSYKIYTNGDVENIKFITVP